MGIEGVCAIIGLALYVIGLTMNVSNRLTKHDTEIESLKQSDSDIRQDIKQIRSDIQQINEKLNRILGICETKDCR
jgi:uncharacterized coiled-coil DUF342 family protein